MPNNTQHFECHIDITSEMSIIDAIQQHCLLSVKEIKVAIDKGALWHTRGQLTQRCRRIKKPLKTSDKLHFYYNKSILELIPPAATLIKDMAQYSVWFKPYGMLSQGSKFSDHCTITRWAQKQLKPQRSVFSVHRLDKAASGLILVAHSKKIAAALSRLFEQHQLTKKYIILVHGDHRQRPQPETITKTIDGKTATSHFTCLTYCKTTNVSKLMVTIASGRKHQIRIHAASIGFPVVGDRLHGNKYPKPAYLKQQNDNKYQTELANNNAMQSLDCANNLQLCAIELSFVCPISQTTQHFHLSENKQPCIENLAFTAG